MQLELHILQNFAPSNLNRDDLGSPKSCEFGGVPRARISSQCIKRSIREEFKGAGLIGADAQAARSKRFIENVATALKGKGRDHDEAISVAQAALALLGVKVAREQKTEYLLFLAAREGEAIVAFCAQNWKALVAVGTGKRDKKDKKNAAAVAQAKDLGKVLDGGKAADLALFGRMLADLPAANREAASQVAHAISTHRVAAESDYYTAVDDLKPDDTSGADMIGNIEFNSACYYRYANIDLAQLRTNLQDDAELAEATVRAFLLASRDAVPSGKQNSFAAQNPPSFVMAVVRDRGAWSLANAFLDPVRPAPDLVTSSIVELDRYWGELVDMYGEPAGVRVAVSALGSAPLDRLKSANSGSFAAMLEATIAAVRPAFAG